MRDHLIYHTNRAVIYNTLIDDEDLDDEDKILKEHLSTLFLMIDKYNLLDLLCIHSAHSHFPLPEGTILYGIDGKSPICRRTKPTPIKDIVDEHVHGHIFVVVNSKLQAYEFQEGDAPDFSCHNLDQFFEEYIDFVKVQKLNKIAGLQMRYGNFKCSEMWECFEGNENIMMDASAAN
ncbi:hypothetical protein MCOR16_001575 [Pyricularia oryzae]|nr:hypothetical protein MCOR15_000416 [Pyricularia oryzae]KAI6538818.1 hypothetical protein MCOR16_001575 [Pyricularia oryzae]